MPLFLIESPLSHDDLVIVEKLSLTGNTKTTSIACRTQRCSYTEGKSRELRVKLKVKQFRFNLGYDLCIES